MSKEERGFGKLKSISTAFTITSFLLILLTSGVQAAVVNLLVEPLVPFMEVFLKTAPLTVALTLVFIVFGTNFAQEYQGTSGVNLWLAFGLVLMGAVYLNNALGYARVEPACSWGGPAVFICYLLGFLRGYGVGYFLSSIVLSVFLIMLYVHWPPTDEP